MAKTDYRALDDAAFSVISAREKRLRKSYQGVLSELRAYYLETEANYGSGGTLTFADINKYNRQQVIQADLANISAGLFQTVTADITMDLRGIYEMSYSATSGLIETATGSALRGNLQLDVLEKAIKTPVGGLSIDLRFDDLRNDITTKLLREMNLGVQNGKSIAQIAQNLKNPMGGNLTSLQRIVRTEGHRLEEQASLDAAMKSRKKMNKIWHSANDSRVRRNHDVLNGTSIPIEENFKSPSGAIGQAPGLMNSAGDDINCRCFLGYEERKEK